MSTPQIFPHIATLKRIAVPCYIPDFSYIMTYSDLALRVGLQHSIVLIVTNKLVYTSSAAVN